VNLTFANGEGEAAKNVVVTLCCLGVNIVNAQ
jgi:hypothetical protein